MSEKPILFSGAMVRAILSGQKTVTRRVVKLREIQPTKTRGYDWCFRDRRGLWNDVSTERLMERKWCPFQVGDSLWVRETFYCDDFRYPNGDIEEMRELLDYRATHDCAFYEAGCPCRDENGRGSWRPSIHMPRWASRLTLAVKSVRIERLQEITEAGAQAEGVAELDGTIDDAKLCAAAKAIGGCPEDSRSWFAYLWDEINGKKHPWASNPYVWVVNFCPAPHPADTPPPLGIPSDAKPVATTDTQPKSNSRANAQHRETTSAAERVCGSIVSRCRTVARHREQESS